MSKQEYLEAVIIGYRKQLSDRYQYESLKAKYDLPQSFDAARVNTFKEYFLEYIYPDIDKRNELNLAFQSLDNYIKHPEKLFRIVLDSGSLIFKFGRHLHKILSAGIKALKCFRTANKFEHLLTQQAISHKLEAPFDGDDFKIMFAAIDPDDLQSFIQNSQSLYAILYNRILVKKIKSLVDELIKKMEKRPNVYGSSEIDGFKIGRDIIKKGDELFDDLESKDQKAILELAIQIERDALGINNTR